MTTQWDKWFRSVGDVFAFCSSPVYVSTAFHYIYTCLRSDLGLSCQPRSRRRLNTPLVFGDFSHIAMDSNSSGLHTLETLTSQVKVNYNKAQLDTGKLKEAMGNMRQRHGRAAHS